jgi:hypothetical protein
VPLPVSREGQDRPFTSSTKIEKLSFDPLTVWLMTIRLLCSESRRSPKEAARSSNQRSVGSNAPFDQNTKLTIRGGELIHLVYNGDLNAYPNESSIAAMKSDSM